LATVIPVPAYPTLEWKGPLPGSATVTAFIGVPLYGQGSSTYTFYANAGYYFPESGGSATCHRDVEQCIHCSGSFAFTFNSIDASAEGTATYWPDGAPIPNTWIIAGREPYDGSFWRQTFTDSAGHYSFRIPASPNTNWGLRLTRAGTSGPGFSSYRFSVNGTATDYVQLGLSSNQLGIANLIFRRGSAAEEPPRCNMPPQNSPGPSAQSTNLSNPFAPTPPCTVGCPVSVTTGNVDIDQVDAVIPGLGLGLNFSRSYNSANTAAAERSGVFGAGWNHSYEKRLTFPYPHPSWNTIKLRNSDGTIAYFIGSDTNGYEQSAPYSRTSRIERVGTLYVRRFRQGGEETYDRQTEFGNTARLISLTDAVGNTTTLSYTADKLTGIADPGGRTLILGYTGAQLTSLSGPAGLIATYTYANGRLSGVTYADGDSDGNPDGGSTFAYHASGNGAGKLHTVTDLSGRITESHEYDANGRASLTAISGNVRQYALSYQTDRTIVTDSLGNQTTYEWKEAAGQRLITKMIGSCSSCGASGDTQSWGYDAKGRVIAYTDGLGKTTEYAYDNDGNLSLKRAPALDTGLQHTTAYSYDANGRLIQRTEPNLATTTWTYVAAGPATITEQVAAGVTRTTTMGYYARASARGKLEFIRDPLNRETQFGYSVLGDLTAVTDAAGHTTTYQHDAMGRRTKTVLPATTPANDTPTTSYDTLGRIWKVTNPNGSYLRNTYDGGGRRITARNPLGHETHYAYDNYGRLATITDALGGVTEYRYDAMSNVRYLIDAKQYPQSDPPLTATEFRYEDGHNRLTKTIYPGNRIEQFSYDAAGRIKTQTDRSGVITTYAYDALGRLTSKSYSSGGSPVTFGYDAGNDTGYLTSASNSADSLTWDYDLAGQTLSESSSRNGTTVSYVYNLAGQREKLRLNGADILTYGYATDGELANLTRASGVVFNIVTDAAHRRQSVSFPNGTTTEYAYDTLSRVAQVRLQHGATTLNDIAYESNDLNNRTSRTENGTRLEYTYDALSRLDTVQQTQPTPSVLKEDYSYDPVGNRLTALGVPGVWNYNERNELTSYNGINFTYDANGNQLRASAHRNVRMHGTWTIKSE
jgi:YD repeat-containing protein